MPPSNYLHMTDDELDKPVFRIIPIHRLLECFQKKQLILVPPQKWDDPFENLLLSAKVTLANGETGITQPIWDKVYGQCWTLHKETDAMWRIYSANKNGAKIKSTPRKLLEALKASDPQFADIHCYIGKVEYIERQKDLVSTLKDIDLFNINGSGIAESLMYKRYEFKHEKEVRLIYIGQSKDIHPFAIDPNTIFDEVIFDPRMDAELYEAYKAAVKAKGFTNRIDQSVLYRLPRDLQTQLNEANGVRQQTKKIDM